MTDDSQSPLMRRIRFANIFSITVVAALFVFSLVNYMSAQYLSCVVELAGGLFGIFLFMQLRASGDIGRAQLQIMLNITVVMSYLFTSGGIARTGIFWLFTFPVAAFFVSGRRRGWLWVATIIGEVLAMMALGIIFHVTVPYSTIELRQFLAAFIVVSILLQHYEAMRDDYEKAIEANMLVLADANANIKTLKGLVPICSSCKKIRDDRGYWQQVEVYVAEHTEADFSHGLCAECAHTLYPEYFDDRKNQEP
ncbi:MAG: hypothetical protein NTZ51_09960 [Proteobacteria bacterium]|nr:hypothetical protein [Pseudomonadota bacterium]